MEEQKSQVQDRFLRGRQIAYMIYEHFQAIGAHEAALVLTDLFTVSSQGDDIQDLIPDGIKFYYLQVKLPETMFWKVCTKGEYESLCNYREYWQCVNKKSIKIDRDQLIRS